MNYNIRVLLIDDQPRFVSEVAGVLTVLEGIEVVGQGGNGQEAINLCEKLQPDIVLMDIGMPVMNGIEATRIIVSRWPSIRVVALSGNHEIDFVRRMIAAGACGYFLKSSYPDAIRDTLHAIHSGRYVLPTELVTQFIGSEPVSSARTADFDLTTREQEILKLLAKGLTYAEIAAQLYVATSTVRFHVYNIIEKLGAKNRTEALIIASHHSLI